MDIIVRTVLDFVKSQEGYEHSVLAGGAVRDTLLKLEPKDYDLIIPDGGRENNQSLLVRIADHFGIENMVDRWEDYGGRQGIAAVDHFEYQGKKFDIISKRQKNDEDFGPEVVAGFDYGLNMAYYDGVSIDDSNENFQDDFRGRTATLINLERMADLPRSLQRFQVWSDKHKETHGWPLTWAQRVFELKKRDKKEFYRDMYSYNRPSARTWATNPVGEIHMETTTIRPWTDTIINVEATRPITAADIRAQIRRLEDNDRPAPELIIRNREPMPTTGTDINEWVWTGGVTPIDDNF